MDRIYTGGISAAARRPLALLLAGVACLALTACEMGAGGGSTETSAPATSARLVDRDVEAPEIFQTEDKALWDGRPSLGGVWVASSDAKDPERVILRNPANGKFVIGGLFRREEALPGPKLQLSSDAAQALGLLAGEPATVSVTALRREEAPVAEPAADAPLLDANTEGAVLPLETDVVTTAAAAIDAVAPVAGAVAGSEAPPAKPSAQTATQTAAEVKPTTKPAGALAPVEVATGRTIQVGIFSQEANAKRAVDVLKAVGVSARSTKETSQGKDLWSVTTKGDQATLATVKSAGFNDAYLLKR
ncbi:SPOR domain-containing protein [Rhodobacter sp. KR11]|uniref:SPOR domain-containing protein n=1 Tax=Rhodobacter sp. KR11 TaxID=2974588 RepID=UPI00222141C1|nr:SPOR domain-containing protein [Rhodobacter sp. KR11]MCW1919360.1 SPOR domain-containing protein [Rhodobacter sp. KR11]